jgi:hypothetical protein
MLAAHGIDPVVTGDIPGLTSGGVAPPAETVLPAGDVSAGGFAEGTSPAAPRPDTAPDDSSRTEAAGDDARPSSPDAASATPASAGATSTPEDDAVFQSRLTRAWEAARRSEFEEAYQALRALGADYPQRVRPYLARYWLLRLNSKLDPSRKACDELCDCLFGVQTGRLAALEMYRR